MVFILHNFFIYWILIKQKTIKSTQMKTMIQCCHHHHHTDFFHQKITLISLFYAQHFLIEKLIIIKFLNKTVSPMVKS